MATPISNVKPGSTTYTHEVALTLPSGKKVGLRLREGLASIRAQAPQANAPVDVISQYSYHLGRGFESFTDKRGHFGWFDSKNLWTPTPGKAYPSMFFYWAKGIHNQDVAWSSDITWKKISTTGDPYLSVSFASTGVVAGKIQFWVRRRGNPSTLTVAVYSNSGSNPDSSLTSATLTTSALDNEEVQLIELIISQTLTASTTYHVVFSSPNTNDTHCWEIGCNALAEGKRSTNGSSWTATTYSPNFRIRTANTTNKFQQFFYDGAMYIVGTNGNLYINGGRGKATSGGATSLTDSALSMTTDRYVGAYIHIIRGTGEGQTRQITANSATAFTVATWDTNPSTDSEYVVYKTPWFHLVGATGINGFTSAAVGADGLTSVKNPPVVANRIVYFPQGDTVNIRRMQWNSSTKVHDFADDSTNKAVFLVKGNSPTEGAQVWRVNNIAGTGSGGADTASRANATVWGTDLVFRLPNAGATVGIYAGDTSSIARGMVAKDTTVYVHKDSELITINSDQATSRDYGAQDMPSINNGAAMAFQENDLFFSFWTNLMVLSNGSVQDTRLWLTNLPSNRTGYVSCIEAAFGWLFFCYNAGDNGTSSVFMYDKTTRSFHEMLRGYKVGRNAYSVFWQPNEETNPYLWTNIQDDMLYQAMPRSPRPLSDTSIEYMPESILVTSTIDLNVNSKFFGKLSAVTKNLSQSGSEIFVDYQTDDFIDTNTWFYAGTLSESPIDSVEIGQGRKRKIRVRFRINTDDASNPPILEQFALEFFEREPSARFITLECEVAPNQRVVHGGGIDHKPTELFNTLDEIAKNTQAITLESIDATLHGKVMTMYAQPYAQKTGTGSRDKEWEGTIAVYLKELL